MFKRLSPLQLTGDIILAALLLLMCLPLSFATSQFSVVSGTQLVYVAVAMSVVVACTAVAFRRISPTLALILAWVSAVIQMTCGLFPGAENLGILIVLFATSAYGSTRTMWWGLVSVGAGSVIGTAYLVLITIAQPVTRGGAVEIPAFFFAALLYFVAMAGAMGLSWALGLIVRTQLRSRRIEKERAIAEALAAAEAHRTQIARDMHDVVAHSLAVVIAQADGARYAAAAHPDAAPEALKTIASTARSALSDVRLLLTQLRHSQAEGPQPTLADLEELYAQVRAAGVDLRIDIDPMPQGDPPAGVQLAVYRILQEALTNAMRHGDGTGVDVFLAWHADRVDLGVHNVPSTTPTSAGGGHGLVGMRERAQLVGGRLDAGAEGHQFVVRAVIPIAQEEA